MPIKQAAMIESPVKAVFGSCNFLLSCFAASARNRLASEVHLFMSSDIPELAGRMTFNLNCNWTEAAKHAIE